MRWMWLGFLGMVAGCSAPAEERAAGALAAEDGAVEPPEDRVVASDESIEEHGIEEWVITAEGKLDRSTLTAIDAGGQVVAIFELVGTVDGITLLAESGDSLVVDGNGNVVDDTLDEPARALLGAFSRDYQAVESSRPSRACVLWYTTTLALAACCGTGMIGCCIGIPAAFCNASHYCGNNVCEL